MKLAVSAIATYIKKLTSWQKVKPFVLSVMALTVTGASLLYLSHSHHAKQYDKLAIDVDRNYQLSPFDMIDATRYCQNKTEKRYGDDLALSYIDEHSTRQDKHSGIYKIFMVAYIGELHDYEEEAVHCFVDPSRRVLTHYRTINLRKASLMNRAMKFFE